MAGGLSKDDLKAIGALEKGVSVLELAVRDNARFMEGMDKRHIEHNYDVIKAIDGLREDFRKEISAVHQKLDDKTGELHTQIDNVIGDHTKLKLHVQKLATSVSVVVGVGIYIVTAVFDAAKDSIGKTLFPH